MKLMAWVIWALLSHLSNTLSPVKCLSFGGAKTHRHCGKHEDTTITTWEGTDQAHTPSPSRLRIFGCRWHYMGYMIMGPLVLQWMSLFELMLYPHWTISLSFARSVHRFTWTWVVEYMLLPDRLMEGKDRGIRWALMCLSLQFPWQWHIRHAAAIGDVLKRVHRCNTDDVCIWSIPLPLSFKLLLSPPSYIH